MNLIPPPPSTSRATLVQSAVGALLLAILPLRAPAATNDSCEAAIDVLPGIPVLVNTTDAAQEEDPISSCGFLGHGVWFTFKPTNSGLVVVRTCYSDFDTVVEVYTGDCSSLVPVPGGCVDDDGPADLGLQASVIVDAKAGVPLHILAGGYGGQYGILTLTVEPIPELQINPAGADQVKLSWLSVEDSWYQVYTSSNLIHTTVGTPPETWVVPTHIFPRTGDGGVLTQAMPAASGRGFFGLGSQGRIYGITDVLVTDEADLALLETETADYTGLDIRRVAKPFVPGQVGGRRIGRAVNLGNGTTTTRIWVKYKELKSAVNAQQEVLTDIAVTEWQEGDARCPDPEGHPLSGSVPCANGWQLASGPSGGIQGGLTNGASLFDSGLCVRYRPAGYIITNQALFIEQLSLSVTDEDNVSYPGGVVGWQSDAGNIGFSGAYSHITYSRRALMAPPTFSDEQKLELLARYAPQVWLPVGEPFNPASVEWAFQYLKRYFTFDGQWSLRTKSPVRFDLGSILDRDTGGGLIQDNDFYHGELASAPVYAFWVEKGGPSVVDLVYFFLFPWNDGKYVSLSKRYYGHHICDWEHVTIRLKDGQPSAIYLSAHDFGQDVEWSRIAKVEGIHPIVFAAEGSHGIWLNAGAHTYSTKALGLIKLTDYCSEGTPWKTWLNLEAYDYTRQKGLSGKPWPGWMGADYSHPGSEDPTIPGNGPIYRWGNPASGWEDYGQRLLEEGPGGPPSKGLWNPLRFE